MLRFITIIFLVLMFQKTGAQNDNIVWADSCASESFFGKIVSPGYSDFSQVHAYPGGDLILVGTAKDNFAQMVISRNYANIMRINAAGNIVWSRFIGITDPVIQVDLRAYASIVTSNGDLVLLLTINAATLSGNYIVRLNGAGAIIWQKRLPYVNPAFPVDIFTDIIETAGDGLLITGSTNTQGIVMKLTGQGVFQWRNLYSSGDYNTVLTGVSESPVAFYVTGTTTSLSNNNSENIIIKIDKLIGKITWIKWISFSGTNPFTAVTEYEFDKMHYKDGVVALTGSTRTNYTGPDRNAQIAVYMDENATILSAIRIENIETEMDPANLFQGSLYDPFTKTAVQSRYSGSNNYYVFRLKDDMEARWAWKIPVSDIHSVMDSKVLSDSSLVVAGLSRDASDIVSANVLKTSAAGKLENCTNLPFPFIISTQSVSLPDNIANLQVTYNISEQTVTSTLDLINSVGISWQIECNSGSTCKMSKIAGENTVCMGSNNIFSVTRNGNCSNAVIFSCNAPVTISPISDSSASFSFPTEGIFVVYARMPVACGTLMDSIIVQVKKPGIPFSLGMDTVICPGNTIRLKVAGDYVTYLWQDGTVDSVYSVSQPGSFFCTVQDACGHLFRDTINIYSAPPFEFSIGPDRVKCNADTLQLHGPSGFYKYQWSPDYHISSVQQSDVIIDPPVDMIYTVEAEKYPGCLAFDTINILVNNFPDIQLGRDTSICVNDTLVLNAGQEFNSYLWSNGNTKSVNVVREPGVYSVTAYDGNGCHSTDTIKISNRFCVDGMYIPSAFTPNQDGLNDVFKPFCSRALNRFYFKIYNRWGEIIFETSDITRGWNGEYKGLKQKENIFIWICRYQFEGEKEVIKKGTVLLIK